MKKISATIFLALFAIVDVSAQGCLPEGITFTTQEEIDNFQVNYPGCTEIEGDVWIEGDDITNLEGLNVITYIGGNLRIQQNTTLISLEGLENLTGIGDGLIIGGSTFIGLHAGNPELVSLSGLNNLVSVGGEVFIADNDMLTSLVGLDNLANVGGSFTIGFSFWGIFGNPSLLSLNGLENLNSVGGDMIIQYNDALPSLVGLNNLSTVGGSLSIGSNMELTDLSGLNNLSYVGGFVSVTGNPQLTSISSLNNLEIIPGGLWITNNDALTEIGGFISLHTIGQLHIMDNINLTSLSGLEGLASIGSLEIQNTSLPNLNELINVVTFGTYLRIANNDALTSLQGLNNIEPGTIETIIIASNAMLSECSIKSICQYLTPPYPFPQIVNNGPGCNTLQEVKDACNAQGIEDQFHLSLAIRPNPTDNGFITITLDNPQNLQLTCFNTFGQQVHQQEIHSAETVINVSTWSPGIYLAVVYEDGKPVGRAKFVVR